MSGQGHRLAPARPLEGKTLFISGASRGIGLAIACRAAEDGANVAFIAKTETPHPKLDGTIHTAAAEIDARGGRSLPLVGDIRDAEAVERAVGRTIEEFGGVDIVVNNASAIALLPTDSLSLKQYDLIQDVNVRGAFVVTKRCLASLREASNPHILTLSPPLNLSPRWFRRHSAYTVSKYGMTMLTLGWAEELREDGVAANCLWPKTLIDTAALRMLPGGEAISTRSRRPAIVADAAHAILGRDSTTCSGNCFVDEDVLLSEGADDLSGYRAAPGTDPLEPDLFLDTPEAAALTASEP